jgi:hypothetical protein
MHATYEIGPVKITAERYLPYPSGLHVQTYLWQYFDYTPVGGYPERIQIAQRATAQPVLAIYKDGQKIHYKEQQPVTKYFGPSIGAKITGWGPVGDVEIYEI